MTGNNYWYKDVLLDAHTQGIEDPELFGLLGARLRGCEQAFLDGALRDAAAVSDSTQLMVQLRDLGANPHAWEGECLLVSAMFSKPEAVRLLLDWGVDPNPRRVVENTQLAVRNCRIPSLRRVKEEILRIFHERGFFGRSKT